MLYENSAIFVMKKENNIVKRVAICCKNFNNMDCYVFDENKKCDYFELREYRCGAIIIIMHRYLNYANIDLVTEVYINNVTDIKIETNC